MRRLLAVAMIVFAAGVCSGETQGGFVLVKGGKFRNPTSNYYNSGAVVPDFYIDRYDVTEKEWRDVMGSDPSKVKGDDLPVEMVSWYDSVEYCNRRSRQEGLEPYYKIDRTRKDPDNKPDPQFGGLDDVRWTVTLNPRANGYRLPTEIEWEYAAGGGQLSKGYVYSGSNDVDEVAWYWRNSGDRYLTGFWYWPTIEQNHAQPKPVGKKKPNELGLYDMSGNVREWCWDWSGDLEMAGSDPKGSRSGFRRVWKGGGWIGAAFCCTSAYRGSLAANGVGPDQGFRVCRGG